MPLTFTFTPATLSSAMSSRADKTSQRTHSEWSEDSRVNCVGSGISKCECGEMQRGAKLRVYLIAEVKMRTDDRSYQRPFRCLGAATLEPEPAC